MPKWKGHNPRGKKAFCRSLGNKAQRRAAKAHAGKMKRRKKLAVKQCKT